MVRNKNFHLEMFFFLDYRVFRLSFKISSNFDKSTHFEFTISIILLTEFNIFLLQEYVLMTGGVLGSLSFTPLMIYPSYLINYLRDG